MTIMMINDDHKVVVRPRHTETRTSRTISGNYGRFEPTWKILAQNWIILKLFMIEEPKYTERN